MADNKTNPVNPLPKHILENLIGTQKLPERDAQAISKRVFTDGPIPWLISLRIIEAGETRMLRFEKELTLGRGIPDADPKTHLNLSLYNGANRGISRLHARLLVHNDQLAIMDLGSTNGTFLNSRRLEPDEAVAINSGDLIELGQLAVQIVFIAQDK